MGGPPKPKTVVIPGQKYPEACVWQPTSNLLVLFKFFVGYSFLVSRPRSYLARERAGRRRVLVLFSKDVSAPAEDLIRSHRAEEFQVWVWHCACPQGCLFLHEFAASSGVKHTAGSQASSNYLPLLIPRVGGSRVAQIPRVLG